MPLVLPVLSVRRGAAGVCRFRLRLCRVGPCPGLCLEGPCRAVPCPDTAGAGACPDRERPWEECEECAASALRARE